MSPNNVSISRFRNIAKHLRKVGVKAHPKRNEFNYRGFKVAYVYAPEHEGEDFCRQFYDDQDGFLFDDGQDIRYYPRSNCRFGAVSRIDTRGVKAYSVHGILTRVA